MLRLYNEFEVYHEDGRVSIILKFIIIIVGMLQTC